jgi:hydroxymethylglutaryl-CoA synthase
MARIGMSLEQRVAPWLKLNAAVGNIYTGSLFLALLDYLRNIDATREGRTASVFAYGSGCGASLQFARVAAGAAAYARRLDPQEDIDRRCRLTPGEYEDIMRAGEDVDANEGPALDPGSWNLPPGFYYRGTRGHARQYGR